MPLYQHVLVGRRMLDLFATSDVDASAGFVREGAPVNHELLRIARDDWASTHIRDRRTPKGRPQRGGRRPVGNGRRVWIPSRVDVLDQLDAVGLLPAIVFIFSRVGCDAAVEQCRRAGIRLTTPEERDEIIEYVEETCARAARPGPPRPGLPRLPRRPLPRRRRAPRRDAAGVQAVRRAALRPRAGQGRVRDRDARARHQHAGPHRRAGEAVEVERRDPRRHHAGGVHPADRPGRSARARRRGPCGRALAAGHEPGRGRRPGLHAYLPAPLELPPVVQHGGQPGRAGGSRAGPRAPGDVLRPVPG